jgi:uncharacterized protein (TIGR02246 family)
MELSETDRRALVELCQRYASFADSRRFDDMGDLFTTDAVLVTQAGQREGRDDIVKAMQGLVRYERTFHLVGQIRHWVDGDDVRGETYCIAHHFNAGDDGATRDRVMYIRYDDVAVREDGVWRLARRALDVAWSGQEDKPLA